MLIGCSEERFSITFQDSEHKIDAQITLDTEGEKILISWKASGWWYFEANFPIEVISDDRTLIYSYATAQWDWMTSELVSFTSEIDIHWIPIETSTYIVFKKANPSWLPEYNFEKKIKIQ
jgi:hypothetical protein